MEGMPPDNGYLLPPFECSNQDSENAKTSLLSCLHINAASVFTMLAAFYFFATYRRVYRKKRTVTEPIGERLCE